jgi:uncharacterized membrane protein YphA (DoxX/SURF4 family)
MRKPFLYSPTSPLTRIFLVLLRLAIGWHLFIEGVTKLESFAVGPTGTSKPFSSRGYLQQSQGPLGPFFRNMAGDPDKQLDAKLSVDPIPANGPGRDALPAVLRQEYQDYLRRFTQHYRLSGDQENQAKALLDKHLDALGEWFQPGKGVRTVTREYPFASVTPSMDVPTRVAEYRTRLKELRELQDAWNLRFDRDVTKNRIAVLRTEVAKLRNELQKDIDEHATKLRVELEKLLTSDQAARDIEVYKPRLMRALKEKGYTPDHQAAAELVKAVSDARRADLLALAETNPEEFLTGVQQDAELKKALLKISNQHAAPPTRVADTWMLDWSDKIVAWGLTVSGLGLLLGCFTRLSCLAGAGLLLLFFISLPPLPGLPDNPMAEGKYLFVNKNLVEALALLALATTRSGRWFGVDALLAYIPPFSWFWKRPKLVVEVDPAAVASASVLGAVPYPYTR